MEIFVTDIADAMHLAKKENATHVISAVTRWEIEAANVNFGKNISWKIFEMDDVIERDDEDAPTKKQVEEILNWAKKLPDDSRIIVHCFAGVSRSTAIALIIKVQELGIDKIATAISWLKSIRPQACPNPVITHFADEILNANGKLFEASEEVANEKLLLLRIAPMLLKD